MEELTPLKEEILGILRQLADICDRAEVHMAEEIQKQGFLSIMMGSIDYSVLGKTDNLYDVAKELRNMGLDFSISADLEYPGDPYLADYTELGIIKGESIQVIKTKIRELINSLDSENTVQKTKQMKSKPSFKSTKPGVFYNELTGIGYVEGERFKFNNNQPEFLVFAELYKKIGKSLKREGVLELSKCKMKGHTNETYFINELVKKMRKRTGLNTDALVMSSGSLTLWCEKLKDSPQNNPKPTPK